MKTLRISRAASMAVLAYALLPLFASPSYGQHEESNLEPLYILQRFIASGYMGDINDIQLYEAWLDVPYDSTDTDSSCVKIIYNPTPSPESQGWAGIYWQNRANNWGEYPGEDLSDDGYSEITFWARGETGREQVEFKAGDINDPTKPYKDSFRATIGRIRLSQEWRQYRIPLQNKDLSSVIGGFCWVASGNANPRGLTFYLDDVKYIAK